MGWTVVLTGTQQDFSDVRKKSILAVKVGMSGCKSVQERRQVGKCFVRGTSDGKIITNTHMWVGRRSSKKHRVTLDNLIINLFLALHEDSDGTTDTI